MKIILIGYGKMGRRIEEIALQQNHTIICKIHSGNVSDLSVKNIQLADVCIDFSCPELALKHIKMIAPYGRGMIMGTTGWYDQLPEAKGIIEQTNMGFLYAPNFSTGVNLFLKIVKEAASLFNEFTEYDIAGWEGHHNQKEDSPSGTAKLIAQTIVQKVKRKSQIVYDLGNRAINPEELHFASVRCGMIPGTHTVAFDSPVDTITLTHQARNREGFARGALAAAEWLQGKAGFYTIEDMLFHGSSTFDR